MDLDRYLSRVGLSDAPRPDLAGLKTVHRAHLTSIPYENLDVQLRRKVTIAREPVLRKVIEQRRGGWCYEMNGVLCWALEELGFKVTRVAGAVMREAMGDVTVGNHLVLKVDLPEGTYLADVGFGDGPIEPVRVSPGGFSDGRFQFALSLADDGWWRLHNHPRGGAKSFDFTLDAADERMLAVRCESLQTSENSPFVQNLVCQRHTSDGIVILRGRVLRYVTPDGSDERLIESADEMLMVLGDEFRLKVPEAAMLWPAICERHEAIFGAGAVLKN